MPVVHDLSRRFERMSQRYGFNCQIQYSICLNAWQTCRVDESVLVQVFYDHFNSKSLEKFALLLKHKNSRLEEVYNIMKSDSYNVIIAELGLFNAIWRCLGPDVHLNFSLLTIIREFLGPSPSVISTKKSKVITGDVTVETWEIKSICADRLANLQKSKSWNIYKLIQCCALDFSAKYAR